MTDPLTRVPELVLGLDVRTLPLSALEGFVLSRIDGRAPVREIVAVTGLPVEQVLSMLDKLCGLGATRWKGEAHTSGVSAKPVVATAQARVEGGGASPVPPASSQTPARSPQPAQEPGQARRKSGNHQPVRRAAMSESGISQPPPDMRRSGLHTAYLSTSPAPPPTPPEPTRADPLATAKTALAMEPVRAPEASAPSLYDERELDEPCDLPRERRKQVLDLFYRLKELDFYEALDIPYGADKKQIRTAYFAFSKSFHPDTMFRKELGSYKAKMEAVFQYLTEAYDTLSKKKARDEYDAYLRSTKATAMAERGLVMATREQAEAARAFAVEVPPPPLVPGSFERRRDQEEEPAPAREVSDEARRLAQEVVGRRLRGVMPARSSQVRLEPVEGPSASQPSGSADPPGPSERQLRHQLARALMDANQATAGSQEERLKQLLEASKAAHERGELEEATKLLRRAISVAPERPDLRADHDVLSRKLSEKLAEEYVVQAQFEAKHGKWAQAALAWGKVCEGRPNDAHAHRQAALALFKVGGDLRGAQKYAQQAAFLAPNDVDARVILAQIYLTLGLKLNAKRELDAALKLDPGSEIVKNLLSDLKG